MWSPSRCEPSRGRNDQKHSIDATDLAAATLTVSPNPPVTNQGASFAVALTVPEAPIDRYGGIGAMVNATTTGRRQRTRIPTPRRGR